LSDCSAFDHNHWIFDAAIGLAKTSWIGERISKVWGEVPHPIKKFMYLLEFQSEDKEAEVFYYESTNF